MDAKLDLIGKHMEDNLKGVHENVGQLREYMDKLREEMKEIQEILKASLEQQNKLREKCGDDEMHISILSTGITPKVERCTSCCKQFHCPLCLKVKPTQLCKLQRHTLKVAFYLKSQLIQTEEEEETRGSAGTHLFSSSLTCRMASWCWSSLVLCLLLTSSSAHDDFFTSISKMTDLLFTEKDLLTSLKNYIQAEEKKLEQIKMYLILILHR
ncbi:prolyl 4-hydroxylase subunit alpha-1-like isoform X1 [Solea senegalensis]|uniref:Prolyl 4-hydroxylase subunit alpha-1-like isoform X1 n=1 Tax=Solea senegalensis TaxID=28829 RepID=A0AAV6RPF8_SOLSE|nr:prolyl 4-hydroxylase subunit alpha-1-like isoform X1 [Solea senegalensis]